MIIMNKNSTIAKDTEKSTSGCDESLTDNLLDMSLAFVTRR